MPNFDQELVIARIKNRRGNRVDLPQPLAPGEFGFAADTKQLFIGVDESNTLTGVDLHVGEPVGSQLVVNTLLEKQVFEFDLLPEQLNLNKPSVYDPMVLIDESTIVNKLLEYSSTTVVSGDRSNDISDLEAEVKMLSDVVTELKQIMITESIPVSDYSILYDYRISTDIVDVDKEYIDNDTLGLDKTTGHYIFTFHIGAINPLPLSVQSSIITKLNAIVRTDNTTNMPVTSNPGANTAYARGKEMIASFLPVDTGRQSSNIAALTNAYALPNGLVNTKQNVEIITEFASLDDNPDKVIHRLMSFTLNPNDSSFNSTLPLPTQLPAGELYPLFTPVYDADLKTGNMEFLLSETDVVTAEFSVSSNDLEYKEIGTFTIVASENLGQAVLNKTSTNITNYTLPEDGGPTLDFKAVYNSSTNAVQVWYRHDFDVPVTFRITLRRWLSESDNVIEIIE